MTRHVFMTGASGFVGKNLIDELDHVYESGEYFLLARSDRAEQAIRDSIHACVGKAMFRGTTAVFFRNVIMEDTCDAKIHVVELSSPSDVRLI